MSPIQPQRCISSIKITMTQSQPSPSKFTTGKLACSWSTDSQHVNINFVEDRLQICWPFTHIQKWYGNVMWVYKFRNVILSVWRMSRSGTATTSAIPFTRVGTDTTPAQPSWKFPSKTKRYNITELSCYHGALRGVEAEERLKQQPGDSHLVRYSDNKEEYILTVLKRVAKGPICQHFVIKTLPPPHNAYTVEGSDRIFYGASKMLKYFRKNPITYKINGIGKPCNHNQSKATHYSSSDDTDSSDDWQDTLETHLTPPPLVTKPPRSPEQPQLPASGEPSTQLAEQ